MSLHDANSFFLLVTVSSFTSPSLSCDLVGHLKEMIILFLLPLIQVSVVGFLSSPVFVFIVSISTSLIVRCFSIEINIIPVLDIHVVGLR